MRQALRDAEAMILAKDGAIRMFGDAQPADASALLAAAHADEATQLREQLGRSQREVEELSEQLGEGERREAAAAKVMREGPTGSGEISDAGSSMLGMQARFEERHAELELVHAEKRALQQLIDGMKRGDMAAIFQQAKEEAEKEVLRRLLSTNIDLQL